MENFESAAGICMVMLMSLAFVALALAFAIIAFEGGYTIMGWVLASSLILIIPMELLHIGMLVQSSRRKEFPIALAVALRQPIVPIVFRPVVSFWWLTHFSIGLLFSVSFALTRVPSNSSVVEWIILASLMFGITLGLAYATYGYLLLSVTTVKPDPRVIQWLWNFRNYVNIGLAIISTAAFLSQQ